MTNNLSSKLNPVVAQVTSAIIQRSRASRADYLARMEAQAEQGPHRKTLPCVIHIAYCNGRPVKMNKSVDITSIVAEKY